VKAAGLLLLAVAATVSGCRRAGETRFLNFDPETTAGHLVSGWSGWEKTSGNDTFVWADAREARVRVTIHGEGDRAVRLRAWSFCWPGAPDQTVTLFVNGARIDTAGLSPEAQVVTFVVPRALWKGGDNDLRLAFARAESPREHLPGSGDARTLAAAVDWLEILPIRSPRADS
jgi:hypothetical protein